MYQVKIRQSASRIFDWKGDPLKRIKLGDVFAVSLPNGIKLYQWAYTGTRWGECIRVFPNLYEQIPSNLEELVCNPHSYVLSFDVKQAYRRGLSTKIGNYLVPKEYPFPDYVIRWTELYPPNKKRFRINFHNFEDLKIVDSFLVDSINEVPKEYQGNCILGSIYSPDWVLYLFDIDFDLYKLEHIYLGDHAEKYQNLLNSMLS